MLNKQVLEDLVGQIRSHCDAPVVVEIDFVEGDVYAVRTTMSFSADDPEPWRCDRAIETAVRDIIGPQMRHDGSGYNLLTNERDNFFYREGAGSAAKRRQWDAGKFETMQSTSTPNPAERSNPSRKLVWDEHNDGSWTSASIEIRVPLPDQPIEGRFRIRPVGKRYYVTFERPHAGNVDTVVPRSKPVTLVEAKKAADKRFAKMQEHYGKKKSQRKVAVDDELTDPLESIQAAIEDGGDTRTYYSNDDEWALVQKRIRADDVRVVSRGQIADGQTWVQITITNKGWKTLERLEAGDRTANPMQDPRSVSDESLREIVREIRAARGLPTTLGIAYELGFEGDRGLGAASRKRLEDRLRAAGLQYVEKNHDWVWVIPASANPDITKLARRLAQGRTR